MPWYDPVVCTAKDQCHDVGVCDAATGACSDPAKADGASCNDGDACSKTDTCLAGACSGTSPVVCGALDQCHDPGSCDHATGSCSSPAKVDGTACDDQNACTRKDSCQNGSCQGGDPVVCPSGNCSAGVCSAVNDAAPT